MSRRFGRRNARGGSRRIEAPATIANLHSWWRADSGVTVATGVSSWVSRVNGHTLTQGTAGFQPALSTAAELGGKPCVSFDGSNDRLDSNEAASVWRFLHDGTGFTAFVSCVGRSGGNFTLWANRLAIGGTGMWYRVDGSATSAYLFLYETTNNIIAATPAHASFAYDTRIITDVSYVESASPEYTIRSTDTTRGSGTTSGPPASGDGSVFALGGLPGGGSEGKFDIAEVILYTRVLGASERTTVYNYLLARYS